MLLTNHVKPKRWTGRKGQVNLLLNFTQTSSNSKDEKPFEAGSQRLWATHVFLLAHSLANGC